MFVEKKKNIFFCTLCFFYAKPFWRRSFGFKTEHKLFQNIVGGLSLAYQVHIHNAPFCSLLTVCVLHG